MFPRTQFDLLKAKVILFTLCLATVVACDKNDKDTAKAEQVTAEVSQSSPRKNDVSPVQVLNAYSPEEYRIAREKITFGNASLAEVRMALTETDAAELTNTVHALFSMRWHRGVHKLVFKLWELDKDEYPELNWQEISREPVRLALASTINRIKISNTGEYQDYMRSFAEHEHEFVRSQVLVGLGFNGDPIDVPYLFEQSNGENDYVARSAITGLGLMNNPEAERALKDLGKTYDGTERGMIVDNILKTGYGLVRTDQLEKQ